MLVIIALLALPTQVNNAPAPFPHTIRGEITAVGEGPGNKRDFEIDRKHRFVITKNTRMMKGDFIGTFMIWDLWAEVTYSKQPQKVWGGKAYPALSIRIIKAKDRIHDK
jgi:hypothetical protein